MRVHAFNGGESLEAKLRALVKKAGEDGVLRVGFFEGATYPDKNNTSVASVAAINEFGTAKTPARPFFRNMIAEKSPGWGKSLGEVAVRNGLNITKTLALMGEGIASQLQDSIVKFDSVPLSEATIKAKGFDKQLIDTAVMINAIGYQVDATEIKHLPPVASRRIKNAKGKK